jgi:hypothetical protein
MRALPRGTGGSLDFGRETQQRRQVIAEDRHLLGEPVPAGLHAVTGVTGESDDGMIELLDLLGHGLDDLVGTSCLTRR